MATFFNQATLTYEGGTVLSNITVGELNQVLSVSKTAVTETYTQGDTVTYVINIQNTGTNLITGLTLQDDLGAYPFDGGTLTPLTLNVDSVRFFVDGILQPPASVMAGPPLSITDISIPAGGNATIIYTTSVNQFAPLGADDTITNTVTVTGPGLTPVTASETITIAEEPSLTIVKSLSPTVVMENGQLTYTFTIQNTGNAPVVATDNAIITDVFDPILSDLVVTFNGVAWTAPANYTYNMTTGLFSTNPGQITVPAATYTQDPATGAWIITPGTSVLTVTGTV